MKKTLVYFTLLITALQSFGQGGDLTPKYSNEFLSIGESVYNFVKDKFQAVWEQLLKVLAPVGDFINGITEGLGGFFTKMAKLGAGELEAPIKNINKQVIELGDNADKTAKSMERVGEAINPPDVDLTPKYDAVKKSIDLLSSSYSKIPKAQFEAQKATIKQTLDDKAFQEKYSSTQGNNILKFKIDFPHAMYLLHINEKSYKLILK